MAFLIRCVGGLAIGAVLTAGSAAFADYFYSIAIGEKRFTAVEDESYRAERTAITACIQEFDPLLCEVLGVQSSGRGGFQAVVAGRKGFFGADRRRQDRADRAALQACQQDARVMNCRLERRGGASDERDPRDQEDDRGRGRQPRLEDIFGR
jgi:hypothetical protein